MLAFDPTAFLAALRVILNATPAAVVTLPETDLIFMANYCCLPAERLHYPSYQQFLQHVDHGLVCPDLPHAEAYYEVYSLLRAEALEQQVKMLGAIAEGKPNWRRYCWLLERRDKQARLKLQNERAQKAKAKQPPTLAPTQAAMDNTPPGAETGTNTVTNQSETAATPTAALQTTQPNSTENTAPKQLTAKQKRLKQEKAQRRYGTWVPSTGRFAPKSHEPAGDSELAKKLNEIGKRYIPYR